MPHAVGRAGRGRLWSRARFNTIERRYAAALVGSSMRCSERESRMKASCTMSSAASRWSTNNRANPTSERVWSRYMAAMTASGSDHSTVTYPLRCWSLPHRSTAVPLPAAIHSRRDRESRPPGAEVRSSAATRPPWIPSPRSPELAPFWILRVLVRFTRPLVSLDTGQTHDKVTAGDNRPGRSEGLSSKSDIGVTTGESLW